MICNGIWHFNAFVAFLEWHSKPTKYLVSGEYAAQLVRYHVGHTGYAWLCLGIAGRAIGCFRVSFLGNMR